MRVLKRFWRNVNSSYYKKKLDDMKLLRRAFCHMRYANNEISCKKTFTRRELKNFSISLLLIEAYRDLLLNSNINLENKLKFNKKFQEIWHLLCGADNELDS